jgi:arsenate reductase-like glutaredoxin family protein
LGDAHTLTRKYRDDLFLYLYFIECESYQGEKGSKFPAHSKNVFKWFNNSLIDLHISEIIKFISKNAEIGDLLCKFNLKSTWEQIGKDLNNYVHTNGIKYARLNFIEDKGLLTEELKKMNAILCSITAMAVAIIILIKPQFISSTDYMDALETGNIPEEGSQYNVAPFVTDFLKKYVDNFNTGIVDFLKNSVFMII